MHIFPAKAAVNVIFVQRFVLPEGIRTDDEKYLLNTLLASVITYCKFLLICHSIYCHNNVTMLL